MDIFSKRDGPRTEDVQARRLLSENSHVIRRLADQISNGGYTAMQRRKAEAAKQPQAQGLIIHDLASASTEVEVRPYVKISLNNRVVLADLSSGKQLCMLGEIRGGRLVLATSENGFITPLDGEVLAAIAHLEGVQVDRNLTEKQLAAALSESLSLS